MMDIVRLKKGTRILDFLNMNCKETLFVLYILEESDFLLEPEPEI